MKKIKPGSARRVFMSTSQYPEYTLWGVWDGWAIPLGWQGAESRVRASEYADKVYQSAHETLARRLSEPLHAYELLLKARLSELADRMLERRQRGKSVVPLDLFDDSEIFFWFTSLAQLLLLGAVELNDEFTFIELFHNGNKA